MTRDPRIDEYIAKAAPFAQDILSHVRDRVHAVVPDVEESIKWGAPAFVRGQSILLIVAAFKAHAAINFWRGKEITVGAAKAGGMGQLGKIASRRDLPTDAALDTMILEAARLAAESPAPRQPKVPPKASPEMHPDFAAALDAHPQAKATLDGFSPSARRDYVDWISEAKQDATRAKRIATAIEWLGEGKKRNWKYENC